MLAGRIKKLRKSLNINTQKGFSELVNFPFSRVQDIERGKVKELKSKEIEHLQEKFLINSWWLLTGKGEIFLKNKENIPSKQESLETVNINFYPEVYAAAGYGALNGDASPKTIQLSKTFLDEILDVRNYSKLDIIRVYGDSMEPYISNGEYVIIEKNHEAYNGETVIANINGEVYIKKFQKDPFGEWVKLISDNKSYDDIHITGDNLSLLQIVGIVRAKIKPF